MTVQPFVHPAAVPHAPLRTFHPRRSALGAARADALARRWSDLGFSVHDDDTVHDNAVRDDTVHDTTVRDDTVRDDGPHDDGLPDGRVQDEAVGRAPLRADGTLDTARLFGRDAPVVLEIGSGMGEAVVTMATDDPERDYLAVEAHLPGIANLVRVLDEGGPTNVRVAYGDALELLRTRIAPDSLDAVHAFFPDPWPKARHHKRRLISPDHVALLRSRLRVGGTLHCATDWMPYAESMLATLSADPGLQNPHGGYAPRPPHRPLTRFEQRGLDLGHPVVDLVVHRRDWIA
jgi:tRNA (guanine-N7-)-methyltransferase